MTECHPVFDAKSFLKTLPNMPGVYRMLNVDADVIYVGKANNLKKRVTSYFTRQNNNAKVHVMVSHICRIDYTVTSNETEALLLENNLIKQLKPRYNIVFRDDKSYPYIHLTAHHYPRLTFHRGAKHHKGKYFGPYPSAGAVRETLGLLQKVFPIRQCEDSFYNNRSRPCLQYQIKRCTAPCVGLITENEYQEDVQNAVLFLEGKSNEVIKSLITKMKHASSILKFETAARYRDQISTLQRVQEKQYISTDGGNVDVVSAVIENGIGCIQVFYFRGGRNIGNKAFFPQIHNKIDVLTPQFLLELFLAQQYVSEIPISAHADIPDEIIINKSFDNVSLVGSAIAATSNKNVTIKSNVRGSRARWIKLAINNASQAILQKQTQKKTLQDRFNELRKVFSLEELPNRIECFDISHTQGEATVASCVVFDHNGPNKKDYRRFNIKDITAGDDYAAMKQALSRRYTKIKKGEAQLPDILLIDGSKGQVNQALDVLEELQIHPDLVMGISKGPGRKPEFDSLYIVTPSKSRTGTKKSLAANSLALHLIQQIRDEAHRFAITGHRQQRQKARSHSVLEEIPGLGQKRRSALLTHFGGLQNVMSAGLEDLCSIPGINAKLAQAIYDTFHQDNAINRDTT